MRLWGSSFSNIWIKSFYLSTITSPSEWSEMQRFPRCDGGVEAGGAESTPLLKSTWRHVEADIKLLFNRHLCVGSVGLGLCEIAGGIGSCRAVAHLPSHLQSTGPLFGNEVSSGWRVRNIAVQGSVWVIFVGVVKSVYSVWMHMTHDNIT